MGIKKYSAMIMWESCLSCRLLFATDIGVINYILRSLHLISENIEWLTTPATAMFALICANVWIGIPFNMILISTRLYLYV